MLELPEMRENRERFFACLVIFTVLFGHSMVLPMLPLFAKMLGTSAALILFMFAIRDAVQIFLRIPFGALSDRVGKKPIVILGVLYFVLTHLFYFLSQGFAFLFVAFVLSGIGLALILPAFEALMSELALPHRVGETMGLFIMSMDLSFIIGPLIGGYLAEIFPLYRPVFLIACSLTLVGLTFVIFFLTETKAHSSTTNPLSELKKVGKQVTEIPGTLKRMLGNTKVLSSSVSVFFQGFIYGPFMSYFPLYASDIGLSEGMIGSCFTAENLSTLFSSYFGRFSDRIGRLKPVIMGLATYTAILALIPIIHEYLILLLLLISLGAGGRLITTSTMAGTIESTDRGERGLGMGVWGTMLRLGMTAGSFSMSIVAALFDLTWVFYTATLTALSGIMMVLFVERKAKHTFSAGDA